MVKRILYLLAGLALVLPMGCTTIAPAPPRALLIRPAYLPSQLPRRLKQRVLDSLANASRLRQPAR